MRAIQLNNLDNGANIYNYDRQIDIEKASIIRSSISERNKELIFKFINNRIAKGFSKARLLKLLNKTKIIATALKKDFDIVTKQDIEDLLIHIQNRTDITDTTKTDYRVITVSPNVNDF